MVGVEDVARTLGTTPRALTYVLYALPSGATWDRWEIHKKKGGTREIVSPRQPLRKWQTRLSDLLYVGHRPTPASTAYAPGSSIKANATPHLRKRWIFQVDLADFFPSIHFGRIRGLFAAYPFERNPDIARILATVACYEGRLAIGSPVSPILANMIASPLDKDLIRFARSVGCYYTRYSDDLTFSSNRTGPHPGLAEKVDGSWTPGDTLRDIVARHSFRINETKTRLSTSSDSQRVTGIIVNEKMNVPRKYIRSIRGMLHKWDSTSLVEMQQEYERRLVGDKHPGAQTAPIEDVLAGRIDHVGHVRGRSDPVYRRLKGRYENLVAGRPMKDGEGQIMSDTLRVLHLSDFHMKAGGNDQDPVLERLSSTVAREDAPHLIVVTGDIAFSGKADQYRRAANWIREELLPAARVGASNLFLVPGNHDVDRSDVGGLLPLLRANLVSNSNQAEASIDGALAGKDRSSLLAPLANYISFAKELGVLRSKDELPWYHSLIEVAGRSVGLMGLCSPLFSQDDDDHGKLQLSLSIVNSLTIEQADIKIAAMHHPWGSFAESSVDAQTEVKRWADVVLHGHLHYEDAAHVASGANSHIRVGAGACYQGSTMPHSFHYLEFAADGSVLRLPWEWKAHAIRDWVRQPTVTLRDAAGG